MNHRLKSAIATTLIQGTLGYALIMALAMTISPEPNRSVTTVNVTPPSTPESPPVVSTPRKEPASRNAPVLAASRPVILRDWSLASPAQRNEDFAKATKWVQDNLPEEEKRLNRWRAEVPQGSGGARVTRLRPPSLPTHTLYWPAAAKESLPIVAWGNGTDGKCSNSSLAYAAFLSEIASHGYFVVAVGNDDIDYPQPEGIEILADGRPIRTQPSALRKAVDWAVGENGRGGGAYAGRLDTGRVAYMGHGCGGGHALQAAADPRTTTVVALNAAARFKPDAAVARKPPLAHFEGAQDDDGVLAAGEANFAWSQAAGWPMYRAALRGVGHDEAYPGPDRRWSRAVVAWLDWQLKGQAKAGLGFTGAARDGWSRVAITGFAEASTPAGPAGPPAAGAEP